MKEEEDTIALKVENPNRRAVSALKLLGYTIKREPSEAHCGAAEKGLPTRYTEMALHFAAAAVCIAVALGSGALPSPQVVSGSGETIAGAGWRVRLKSCEPQPGQPRLEWPAAAGRRLGLITGFIDERLRFTTTASETASLEFYRDGRMVLQARGREGDLIGGDDFAAALISIDCASGEVVLKLVDKLAMWWVLYVLLILLSGAAILRAASRWRRVYFAGIGGELFILIKTGSPLVSRKVIAEYIITALS